MNCESCERMAKAEESIISLKEDNKAMSDKLDKLQYWMMTTAVGVAITMILVLVKGRVA